MVFSSPFQKDSFSCKQTAFDAPPPAAAEYQNFLSQLHL
jgi:hypothetical protein